MKETLDKIKILGFGSIIIGLILIIKIPETIISLFLLTNFSPLNISKQLLNLTLLTYIISIVLIIGGIYLLKKKRWAKNLLETTYFILLVSSLIYIGKTIGTILLNLTSNTMSKNALILNISLLFPLFIMTLIVFVAFITIRNKKINQIL